MGVDLQAIRLLTEYRKKKALGTVLMLGRQGLSLSEGDIKTAVDDYGISRALLDTEWSENLLIQHFGAITVDSLDISKFEGASLTYDLNMPIEDPPSFDTVIDFGTTEHIFDVKTVYRNIRNLCKLDGGILHILPSNNLSGHGFYQFSPMFFRSVYDNKSGFQLSNIFLSKILTDKGWLEVNLIAPTDRFVFHNQAPTTVLVISIRASNRELGAIQQPDYQNRWDGSKDCGVNKSTNVFLRNIKTILIERKFKKTFLILERIYRKYNKYYGYSIRLEKSPYVKKKNDI